MSRMLLSTGGTLVGAAIGSAIPGVGTTIGASIGGAVGGVAGALLFPPPPTYGPRLEDTAIAPGTYGSPIGICYGLSHFQCDLIWVEGGELKEVRNKQSAGKGGGPTHVTYQYFATFAVLICDSEIAGVRRIYAGKDLVYDASSEALDAAIASGDPLPLTGALEGITLRIYTGTATQGPDPSIEAEDPEAPAWRGMAYLVFEDMPLEKFGPNIPPIFAEVVQAGAAGRPRHGLPAVGSSNSINASFDPARGRLVWAANSSAPAGIRVYDALAGTLERVDDLTGLPNVWQSDAYGSLSAQIDIFGDPDLVDIYNRIPVCFAPDGSFYCIAASVSGVGVIGFGFAITVEAETGAFLAQLATDLNLSAGSSYGFASKETTLGEGAFPTDHRLRLVDSLPLDPLTGVQPFLYLRACENARVYFGPVSVADRGAVAINGAVHVADMDTTERNLFFADCDGSGEKLFVVYLAAGGGQKIARATLSGTAETAAGGAEVEPEISATISGIGVIRDLLYARDAGTVCVVGLDGVAVYDQDLNLVGQTAASEMQFTGRRGIAGHIDGRIWAIAENTAAGAVKDTLRGYSTATGAEAEVYPLSDWGTADGLDAHAIWRVRGDIWVGYAGFGSAGSQTFERQPFLLFGDRWATPRVPLADVLSDAAARAGMDPAALDLTAVSRLIYGAPQKAGNVTARGVWEDLLLHTGHDAMMIDGVLTVRPRASASSGTLTEDDLGADGGPAFLRRSNPSAVLRRVEVTYKSVAAQLEEASQADEFPVEVAPGGEVARFGTALVMDDDEAWADTQRLLVTGASERTEIEAAVPYSRGELEPAQIWTLSAAGASHDMRLSEIDGGRVLKLRGTAAWPFLAPAGTPIDSSRPAPALAEIPATDFALIDSHIWRDEDDSAAFHLAAWPRRDSPAWDGAVIYRGSDPAVIADEFAVITVAAAAGVARTALGDVVSPNHWDRANVLTVAMIAGAPESASEAEVLAGANPLWVECAGGEWELVQYATATENADGSWTLSDLLRGRRGTEHLTGDHAIGDRVIWAAAATARRVGGGSIGAPRYYRSASIGASQDTSTTRALTNRARALRPYSVVAVEGSRDGSGNLTITWTRRTRIHGDVSKTSVPLGEASEAYEVDVLDGAGTVLRTISVTSETASYSAADQTTDFGSTQAAIDVEIYQISDTVGRGVVKEATV